MIAYCNCLCFNVFSLQETQCAKCYILGSNTLVIIGKYGPLAGRENVVLLIGT